MLKNSKGISLVEVTFSLAILTTVIIMLTPMLITTYEERIAVKQQLYAYELIENSLAEWIHTSIPRIEEKEIDNDGTTYKLTSLIDDTKTIQICVNWQARNGRSYNECGTGKRK